MDEHKYHKGKVKGKTYVSKRIVKEAIKDESGNVLIPEQKIRIASKVFDNSGTDHFAIVKGELIIRRTAGGRQEIKASFYEDSRSLQTLTIQRYTSKTDNPLKTHFSFSPEEVKTIIEFLSHIKLLNLSDSGSINMKDAELQKLLLDKDKVMAMFHADAKAVAEFARNEITSEDIIALGYRKKQLENFKKLLDPIKMASTIKQRNANGEEKVWQDFFEKNPWIFGYGLNYVFSSNLDEKKLEIPVKGNDLRGPGKIIDALLKSLGAINSLCYVEIKKASTPLLSQKTSISKPYRPACWPVSTEVSGGVTQIQNTVELAIEQLGRKLDVKDKLGNPTGETVFNFRPKSFLLIGKLDQFVAEHGINEDKFRSFELYRRNLTTPEIITFDELYVRAKSIVDSQINQ